MNVRSSAGEEVCHFPACRVQYSTESLVCAMVKKKSVCVSVHVGFILLGMSVRLEKKKTQKLS